MDILVKNNYLFAKNRKLRCALGLNGITKNKKEGDLCTPSGTFCFNRIYYRADKLGKMSFKIESSTIQECDGWCDDPKSQFYNKYIQFPFNESAEHLYREDNIYDIVCVLNHNTSPIIPDLGSAIFLHVARPNFEETAGCIAIEKEALIEISTYLSNQSKIIIEI